MTSPCSETVMNIPGRSAPSGLGISARTKMRTRNRIDARIEIRHLAFEARPRRPAVVAFTGSPMLKHDK